jgi:hypothetical protein
MIITPEEMFAKNMEDPEWKAWFNCQPEVIQNLAKQCPFDTYKIKAGAPYGVTCEGSIVHLLSFTESGEVGIVLLARDKLPAAIQHEQKMCALHGTDYSKVKNENIRAYVDPVWLEPYFPPYKPS